MIPPQPVWQVEMESSTDDGSMGDNTIRNDLLGRKAGWAAEEVGLNPSGATTTNGEAEPLQCQQDDDSDGTVLMEYSYESKEDSLEAK
jgi:hypothetical protein